MAGVHLQGVLHTMKGGPDAAPRSACDCVRRAYSKGDMWPLLLCMAIGLGVGVALSCTEAPKALVAWITLPGELYLRALKCLVVPYMFCSLVLGMCEMSKTGRAGSLGLCTLALYLATTLLGSVEGLAAVAAFRPMFSRPPLEGARDAGARVRLECAPGAFLSWDNASHAVRCGAPGSSRSDFRLHDLTEPPVQTASGTIQDLLRAAVPDNIFRAFFYPTVLSVLAVAMVFGHEVGRFEPAPGEPNYVLLFVQQLNGVLVALLNRIIGLTPLAIPCLIAGGIAQEQHLSQVV